MAGDNRLMARLIERRAYDARLRDKKRKERDRQRRLLAALVSTVAAFTASLCLQAQEAIPRHTSVLTGHGWLSELLNGHPDRFRSQLGMGQHVFLRLLGELQSFSGLVHTKFVSAEEKLAIFLHFVRSGCSSRMLQEQFQRSADTVSKYVNSSSLRRVFFSCQRRSIHTILNCLVGSFYQKHVHLPADETPYEIKTNPKLYPYFRNCRGAIDSSHFYALVAAGLIGRYRNRKGYIGQNVLAACNLQCYLSIF
jgi:hypothetical protein